MNLTDLRIIECGLQDVKTFVESHHYSKSVKGITSKLFVFQVGKYVPITTQFYLREGKWEMLGAAIFGEPPMQNQIAKYSENGKFNLTELRRFVLVDDTPRCAEGFVLGEMLRRLRDRGIQKILSYSDPSHGHNGIIYRGLGFDLIGMTPATQVIRMKDGTRFAHRSINRYDINGKLGAASQRIREALKTGEAVIQLEAPKYIYLKTLIVLLLLLAALAALAREAERDPGQKAVR